MVRPRYRFAYSEAEGEIPAFIPVLARVSRVSCRDHNIV